MKRFLFALCFSLLTVGIAPALMAETNIANQPGQASHIRWHTNYNQAVQESQKTGRPLLLFFTGSDWCGWCKKMQQEVFSSPDFAQAVGNTFVFVEVDFPMNKQLPPELAKKNAELKQQFGVTGYPTIVILDSNQKYVTEAGYRPGGGKAYAEYLKQFVK